MEPVSLGKSLAVPCVQDLAKEISPTTVPARYLRLDQEPPIIINNDAASLPKIPVIDMQRLISDELELDKMDRACREWGFFQLINHGVDDSLVDKVKVGIQEFFNLPMEEKNKYWQRPEEMEGFGQAFVVSEEQKLDWGDMFYMITLPEHARKPHLFPELPQPFRDNVEAYSAEMKNLAMKILHRMAEALRMKPEEINDMFEEGCQMMRMNYYPPCPQPELVIGLDSHSDAVGLTILLQVNEMEGLQIRKSGRWIPVEPLPNAFVLNIGDMLEIVTNGIYRSTEHRAAVNSVKERLSIGTFYSPSLDGEMGPAPSLVTPETPAVYRRIGVADFFKGYFSRELVGKSYVDVMRIQNGGDDENN
ncbi:OXOGLUTARATE/IRON-DEPENDENT DIOXYGENASE [Salix koriyanagi]|uniref:OXOGLUTARATE/IRON-DEPENDENT DIOXYGENASE n=1 Tax=Salix koriyanagi TaxID=2511006 RepID=A0A9Q1ALJ7_9ROSI|nr:OXOGLUTARATE/IRON-DEPENDENT DIOXYGENASE [Salix koriyanagi]